jgi:hypothetical protein
MMTRRASPSWGDRQVSPTPMITIRTVPALLPAHHRRVARTHVTLKDFADPLETGPIRCRWTPRAGESSNAAWLTAEASAPATLK